MLTEMQLYSYGGRHVRIIELDGEVWLVAKDVCDILGLTNPTMAIQELDDDEKMTLSNSEGHSGKRGGAQSYNVINEAGLYKLTFKSRKPAAKEFTRWVTHEVLPSIRKTGSYTAPHADPELEPQNIRVRIAGVLQRLALQVSSKTEREIINREAYKYATGHDLPKASPAPKAKRKPRCWTAEQIASTLKWSPEAVIHRAAKLSIGHWDGETLCFSKAERAKFLDLVMRGVERIEDGYEYYEGGFKRIHWSFDADAARP